MERKLLIKEIVDFCCDYKLFKNPTDAKLINENIEEQLNDVAFIENLYNVIFRKAKQYHLLGQKRVIDLLMELEKIRLKLEHNGFDK